jgi:hypothetical protein
MFLNHYIKNTFNLLGNRFVYQNQERPKPQPEVQKGTPEVDPVSKAEAIDANNKDALRREASALQANIKTLDVLIAPIESKPGFRGLLAEREKIRATQRGVEKYTDEQKEDLEKYDSLFQKREEFKGALAIVQSKLKGEHIADTNRATEAERAAAQKPSEYWTEAGGQKYTFKTENGRNLFEDAVKSGIKPQLAYSRTQLFEAGRATEDEIALAEKSERLNDKKIKQALKLVDSFEGDKLAKLLGYENCQAVIDSENKGNLVQRFTDMGFEPYQAENVYKVIEDGTIDHQWRDSANAPFKSVSQAYRRKREPLALSTPESYAESKMSDEERAKLQAKREEEESKKASASLF